jgi:dihydroorotate dehydrogenase electron transfer subunit
MKKFVSDFSLIRNTKISDNYFVLELKCPHALPPINPGQFVEVLVPDSAETYLRRPFSVYDVNYETNTISLLIKILGKGTLKLSECKPGTIINMVYPLGNSFSILHGKRSLLVGGGVGIAPMLMLSRELKKNNGVVTILIGGRSSKEIIEPEKYSHCDSVEITTDDGSMGFKGLITHHPLFTTEKITEFDYIYACGPDIMMKSVASIAAKNKIEIELSLENTMACGVGACLCCVVETHEGNLTTCVDGPVFNANRLKL